MRNWPRIFLGWCVVALIVSVVAWGATFSPSYHKCAADSANDENKGGIGVFLLCEGKFIDENNGTLTAIATIGIAGFTLTLWLGTGRQARLTQATLQLARDEFNATHRPKLRVRYFRREAAGINSTTIKVAVVNVGNGTGWLIGDRMDAEFLDPAKIWVNPSFENSKSSLDFRKFEVLIAFVLWRER